MEPPLSPGPPAGVTDSAGSPTAGGWWCYLLQCADGTVYCGITNHLSRRVEAHNRGTGARYTRGRGPVVLIHAEPWVDRAAALRRERAIKRLSRRGKLALCGTLPSRL